MHFPPTNECKINKFQTTNNFTPYMMHEMSNFQPKHYLQFRHKANRRRASTKAFAQAQQTIKRAAIYHPNAWLLNEQNGSTVRHIDILIFSISIGAMYPHLGCLRHAFRESLSRHISQSQIKFRLTIDKLDAGF